jgi:hypothetical protein
VFRLLAGIWWEQRASFIRRLHPCGTPNGVKVTIMLEELLALGHHGAEYDAWLIRIGEGDQFGEGEVANARQREIGGHPAELLRNVCLRKDPHSSYADRDGYVPFGQLEDYTGGRSNGCTSWSPSDAGEIIAMVKDDPATPSRKR